MVEQVPPSSQLESLGGKLGLPPDPVGIVASPGRLLEALSMQWAEQKMAQGRGSEPSPS